MSSRLLIGLAAVSGVALVSCVPYPDNRDPRPGQQQQQQATLTTPEQQALEKQRQEKKKREEQAKKEAENLNKSPEGGNTPEAGGESTQPKPKPKLEKKDYPFASKIEGKVGFVLSPYTNSMVDVRDIPTGTLVEDPTQKGEKKLFRVP